MHKEAELCLESTVRVYGHKLANAALAPQIKTLNQCSERSKKVRCALRARSTTERAKCTMINLAHGPSLPRLTSPMACAILGEA